MTKARIIPGGGGRNSVMRNPNMSARAITTAEWVKDKGLSGACGDTAGTGTSVFDPVLCELLYRWFCPPAGSILDPFAGGSVRGVVAGALGYSYNGIELREGQIAANRAQAVDMKDWLSPSPVWHCADACNAASMFGRESFDLIMSCPPYGDLEVYSDDPRDISNMSYADFRKTLAHIVYGIEPLLKPDRFAAFVVGDFRDKQGFLRNFPAHVVEAFESAGIRYYNDAILMTAAGSLPVRVGKQFSVSRKMGRTHQSVLVFCKGDPRKATAACNGDAT